MVACPIGEGHKTEYRPIIDAGLVAGDNVCQSSIGRRGPETWPGSAGSSPKRTSLMKGATPRTSSSTSTKLRQLHRHANMTSAPKALEADGENMIRRTHNEVKPIGFVVLVLLLGMSGMIAACSTDAWRAGSGVPGPYKNACRSESCAF